MLMSSKSLYGTLHRRIDVVQIAKREVVPVMLLCDDHKDFYEHVSLPLIYEPSKESGKSTAKDLRLHVAGAFLSFPFFSCFLSSSMLPHIALGFVAHLKSSCKRRGKIYLS